MTFDKRSSSQLTNKVYDPTKKGAFRLPKLFVMKMVGRDGFEPT